MRGNETDESRAKEAAPELEGRLRIMAVAGQLFAAKGFNGTSIRDIARAADMSMSNMYHHFGSKENVLIAIYEEGADEIRNELAAVVNLDMDPVARLELLVVRHMKYARKVNSKARLFTVEIDQIPEGARKPVAKCERGILDIYEQELRLVRALGRLKPIDITVAAFIIIAAVNWPLRWYREGGRLSYGEVCENTVQVIREGLLK
jgi:AcrR family transcriptional regulator